MPTSPQPLQSNIKCRVLAERVYKEYHLGDVTFEALKGVSLSVMDGDFLAIAGSSGSGKTTLLNLFGCIDSITSGSIRIDNYDIASLNPHQLSNFRAHKIGFIFQTFNLLSVLSVWENVEYPLLILGVPKKQRLERVEKALAEVGLETHRHHRPSQLSGGQRQRVAIARALVKNPSLILADEPTANLDKATANGILDLMQRINRETGSTFIFSSHDPDLLSRVERVVHLSDGKVVG